MTQTQQVERSAESAEDEAVPPAPTQSARSQQVGDVDETEPEHTHPPVTHSHVHYHVTHHRVAGMLVEWQHRTFRHTHVHNHAELTHVHSYPEDQEPVTHAREAHVHDHTSPVHSPA